MKSDVNPSLERTLESAVIVSWADLMHDAQTGLIHIEYGFAPTGTLDYLKIWSSVTRGHWLLACQSWMSESAFHSVWLAVRQWLRIGKIGGHSGICDATPELLYASHEPGPAGTASDFNATEEEGAAAGDWIRDAFDRLGATLAEPVLA